MAIRLGTQLHRLRIPAWELLQGAGTRSGKLELFNGEQTSRPRQLPCGFSGRRRGPRQRIEIGGRSQSHAIRLHFGICSARPLSPTCARGNLQTERRESALTTKESALIPNILSTQTRE